MKTNLFVHRVAVILNVEIVLLSFMEYPRQSWNLFDAALSHFLPNCLRFIPHCSSCVDIVHEDIRDLRYGIDVVEGVGSSLSSRNVTVQSS